MPNCQAPDRARSLLTQNSTVASPGLISRTTTRIGIVLPAGPLSSRHCCLSRLFPRRWCSILLRVDITLCLPTGIDLCHSRSSLIAKLGALRLATAVALVVIQRFPVLRRRYDHFPRRVPFQSAGRRNGRIARIRFAVEKELCLKARLNPSGLHPYTHGPPPM